MPNQLLPNPSKVNRCADRDLHSTRSEQAVGSGFEVQDTVDDATHGAAHEHDSLCLDDRIELSRRDKSPDFSVPAASVAGHGAGTLAHTQPMCNSISACFWCWWRSFPPDVNPAYDRPFLKARKFVHLPAQWVNVPRPVV